MVEKSLMPCCQEKPLGSLLVTVPQTDTGGLGENPKARERTLVKEFGKITPYLRKKECPWWSRGLPTEAAGGRRETAGATVYQKHRSLLRRKPMYRGRRLSGAVRLRGEVSASEALN